MNFLVDNALSPVVAAGLRAAGHEALHVRDVALTDAADTTVQAFAAQESRIVVSADTDFGALLAQSQATHPSFILFRGATTRSPDAQVRLLVANLPALAADLTAGCIAVFEEDRIRVRRLPLGG